MILCLRLPHLSLIAAWQKEPALRGRPLILGGYPRERGTVTAASDQASVRGVSPGMSLNQAEQACPDAVFQPVDSEATAKTRTLLLACLYAFTSEVTADQDGIACIELDGLRLKWPQQNRLLAAVAARVEAALGIRPALGVATTLFVSRLAASRAAPGIPVVVDPQKTLDYLAPLSIDTLPLQEDMRTYLELLGLRTLGALRTISRTAWRRQFGPRALELYDLAAGIDPRTIGSWRPPARIEQSMPLDPPVDNTQALQFVARALTDRIGESLVAQGLGTRLIMVVLHQDSAPALQLKASFAYPLSLACELFDGIRPRLLKASVVSPIERITLKATRLEPAHVRQPGLLLRRDGLRETLTDAVARLQEEYRPELVQKAALIADAPPLPSRQISWRSA
jgi:DNA polymerase-4